jgi:hypothetical protein
MRPDYPRWLRIWSWAWWVLFVVTMAASAIRRVETRWMIYGGLAWSVVFCALLLLGRRTERGRDSNCDTTEKCQSRHDSCA